MAQAPHLLPVPQELELLEGKGMVVPPRLSFSTPTTFAGSTEHLGAFAQALWVGYGQILEPIASDEQGLAHLRVQLNPQMAPSSYQVEIGDAVQVQVADLKGLAHATATLLQLWCPTGDSLPSLTVEDAPANPYRSLLVDLGRNPHSLALMKETIDLLWFYKVDSLHLHLTDDQRFAFPSKAFPKLVSEGTWSLAEFHELEAYAVHRGVTLIPELETPGHGTLLRQHYPEVFGATPTELASLPTAREGLKTLLGEMMEVFQDTPDLHVGGDEAYGVPHELQQDLVNELHGFLKEHGRTAVVWEGPPLGKGEHKIDTDVIHINWRTIDFPADAMLEAGYPVVNAAWDPLYLVDHYPGNNFTMAAPEHIYRTLQRTRFGHFNPQISTFEDPIIMEPHERILGYCMPWWEGRERFFLPLVTSRLIAMAAVAWSEPEVRDVDAFSKSVASTEAVRRRSFYSVELQHPTPQSPHHLVFSGKLELELLARIPDPFHSAQAGVRYTLDGTEPTRRSALMEGPLKINSSCQLRAQLYLGDKAVGHGSRWLLQQVQPEPNLALHKPVTSTAPEGPYFSTSRLTDGGTGNLDYYLGYPAMPKPIDLKVDLEEIQSVEKIVIHTYRAGESFESFTVALSADGKEWGTVADRLVKPEGESSPATFSFPALKARFLRIRTFGHKGQVFDSFSRITEIQAF